MVDIDSRSNPAHRLRLASWLGTKPFSRMHPEFKADKAIRAMLLLIVAALFLGCGAIPNAREYLDAKFYYEQNPSFVGPDGPLTEEQGRRIIAGLERRQKMPTDILQRHLAFEQALSDVPLVLGNKVTLLENGSATYRAMLEAIHGAQDSVNLEMYIISDGPVGQMFADALIERQRHGVQVNVMYDSFGSIANAGKLL